MSWDPRLPNSCKFYGFKTRNLPSADVLRLDGQPCQGFAVKVVPCRKPDDKEVNWMA